MTEPVEISSPPESIGGLLRAARVLLNRGTNLEAVQVLHAQISNALDGPTRVPVRYSSVGQARDIQRRLLEEWEAREHRQPTALQALLRRRPSWFDRAAAAAVVLLLTLRYAWLVTYGKDWARQNPEGSWVSRFYRNASFEGYPLVRYDVGVNADWGKASPADNVPKDNFSARWDTCVAVKQDVVIPLALTSDDASQLFLDDQLQFEVSPGPGRNAAPITLRPGVHQLRVDFVEKTMTAMVRLDGFEAEGTEAYSFRRPVFEGEQLKCR